MKLQGYVFPRVHRPTEEPGLCDSKVTDVAESLHHPGRPSMMSVTLKEPAALECRQEDGRHGGQDSV